MTQKRCGSNRRRRAKDENARPGGGVAASLNGRREMSAAEMDRAATEALRRRGKYTRGWKAHVSATGTEQGGVLE